MGNKSISADAVSEILIREGFHLETFDSNGEALYCKERPGRVSIYVTVPLGCDPILETTAKHMVLNLRTSVMMLRDLWTQQ